MNVNRVYAVYFSPTGTTRALITYLAKGIADQLKSAVAYWDFTLPEQRRQIPVPGISDLFILGLPVYAGRLPNLMLKYLSSFKGEGALAVPVVLFGNRSYGNALVELRDLLEGTGFHTIAAAAFVGQHAFSGQLAKGRPDAADLTLAGQFVITIIKRVETLQKGDPWMPVNVPGKGAPDYGGYYQPLGQEGKPVDMLKVKPVTTADCIHCKRCVGVCPLGSINPDDVSRLTGICIKCNACIKVCPVHAKRLTDPAYLSHLHYLEATYTNRSVVELF